MKVIFLLGFREVTVRLKFEVRWEDEERLKRVILREVREKEGRWGR